MLFLTGLFTLAFVDNSHSQNNIERKNYDVVFTPNSREVDLKIKNEREAIIFAKGHGILGISSKEIEQDKLWKLKASLSAIKESDEGGDYWVVTLKTKNLETPYVCKMYLMPTGYKLNKICDWE